MGEEVLSYRQTAGASKVNEEEQAMLGMMGETPEPAETITTHEDFYLWESNEEVFSIYKTLQGYYLEGYDLATDLLLAMITEASMPVRLTLNYIYFIHSEYVTLASESIPEETDE